MNVFFKIGLPWAATLGVVFFIGLELGSKKNDPNYLDSEKILVGDDNADKPINPFPTSRNPESTPVKSVIKGDRSPIKVPNEIYSPPLPPNLRRIMEDGSILERMGAYMDALRGMDINSVGEVVNAFEALPTGYGRHLEMKLLMRSWANLDPISAFNYAEKSLDAKSERRFAISEVLAGWAARDSNGAISWVKQYQARNPDSKESANLMVGVVKGLAETDLTSADQFFRTLPEGNAKWQASTFLAQEYANLSTEEAIQWAENFPDKDERMKAMILGQLGSKIAQKDLQGAARWAERMPSNKASEQVMSNLLARWTSQNPQQAADWVGQIQDSEKRVKAMKLLTNKWSLRDPVATASWLNNFPPSTELDPVVSEFVNRISSRDPEGAVGWAESILGETEKERALSRALKAWDLKDPAKANEWRIANSRQLKK